MIRLVGTGHIFERSVRDVESAIGEVDPGFVAVELDAGRFRSLEENGWDLSSREYDMSFSSAVSEALRGGSFPVLFQFFLSRIQQDLGKNLGIDAGSDMAAAVRKAREEKRRIALVDRDIQVTLNHMLAVPFKEKLRLFSRGDSEMESLSGIMGGGIEEFLKEENVEKLMAPVREKLPCLYSALVGERDMYMALALRNLQARNPEDDIVAVVGAGHIPGLRHYIMNPGEIKRDRLTDLRPVSRLQLLALLPLVFFMYLWIKIKFRFRK